MKKNKTSLLPLLMLVTLFTSITLLIFGPYEIFIMNRNSFEFLFTDFYWIPLVVGGVYFLLITLLGLILPFKLSLFLVILEFSLTLCCYVQAMFLNEKMDSLLGQEIIWDFNTTIPNLLIWGVIILLIFILTYKYKEKGFSTIKFISFALTTMQLVALVSLLLTTDVLTTKDDNRGYPTAEGMLSLSEKNNVVVFLLDYFDGRTLNTVLEYRPDLLSELNGFTYYPNATSVYSRTYPSVTYLLTGNMCYFDKEFSTYVDESHANGKLLPTLSQNNIDLGLFTFGQYIGTSITDSISNWSYEDMKLHKVVLEKYLLQIVLYRDMPYMIKPYFKYEPSDINNDIKKEMVQTIQPYQNFDDEWIKSEFEKGIYIDKNINENGAFRFFHLASCHTNLTQPIEPAIYAFEIVNNYLTQMKQLGIYDDSTIIIMTDHGSSGGFGNTLDMPQETAVPIFFVKPSGAPALPIEISNAPVSHTEFIPTVLNGFDLNYSDTGETIYNISETENRERKYYYSALYSDNEGEIELREYRIDGDARESSSYVFTGNKWDILYSENKVANQSK